MLMVLVMGWPRIRRDHPRSQPYRPHVAVTLIGIVRIKAGNQSSEIKILTETRVNAGLRNPASRALIPDHDTNDTNPGRRETPTIQSQDTIGCGGWFRCRCCACLVLPPRPR